MCQSGSLYTKMSRKYLLYGKRLSLLMNSLSPTKTPFLGTSPPLTVRLILGLVTRVFHVLVHPSLDLRQIGNVFSVRTDHLVADCDAWKRRQQTAFSKPKGVGLVKTVASCSPPPSQAGPECFRPFIFPAFVSLTGEADDQRPVTVLRDTGGSQYSSFPPCCP